MASFANSYNYVKFVIHLLKWNEIQLLWNLSLFLQLSMPNHVMPCVQYEM